jgi:hypothetical protein
MEEKHEESDVWVDLGESLREKERGLGAMEEMN